MIVLLDIEWIGDQEKHMTQLSAMRVTPYWWAMDRMDIIVRPEDGCAFDSDHVAYGGYPESKFAEGVAEEDGIISFSEWLQPDDTIWVWAATNQKYFQELWSKYISDEVPNIAVQSGRARGLASKQGLTDNSPYDILSSLGKDPPYPEHRSANDIEVMCHLFSRLNLTPKRSKPLTPPAPKSALPRRERNAIWVDKAKYNYIYVEGSKVFHKKGCKHYLNGKLLLGSKYYETAAKGHRPCKCCKPTPPNQTPEVKAGTLPKTPEEIEALRKRRNEVVTAKMLGGTTMDIRLGKIIGWCHCALHPGAINKCILNQHRCLNKECRHFEKNEASTYWEALENEQRAREKQKRKKQAAKAQRSRENENLQITKNTWQSYINDLDYDMTIVRVAQPAPWMYTIFYVSDNPFADGNRYPDFLQRVKDNDPRVRITLRHIRGLDGRFVTTEQYRARPR